MSEEKKKVIKEIDEFEEKVEREAELKKILQYVIPEKEFKKTAEFVKDGFDYVIEIEEFFRKDFFFDWLPKKIKKYLKLLIPFVLMFIVLYLPLDINNEIKKALALFVCISFLWALESISMIVTALFIPVLAVALGLIKDSNPFSSFSNPIIYLLLSGLIIGMAFRKHGIDRYLALKVMAFSKGSIKRLLFFTMLITGLLGMWMSNTATLALMIPVILSISKEINQRTEKDYTAMLLLSAGFGGAILGLSTILGGNPNAITAAFLRNISDFTFFDWTKIGFPVSIILFMLAYFIFIKMYNVKEEKIDISNLILSAKQQKLSVDQEKVLLIFLPTIFLWIFGGELSSFLKLPLDFYRTEVIGLSASILLFAFKLLEWEDVRKVPWEIFLLVGGGLTLGQILIDSGTSLYISEKLFILFQYFPKWTVILIIVFSAVILANFVNNSSTVIILVPILINLSSMLGIEKQVVAIGAVMATAISPLTPIAIPSFSLIYGTGNVSRKEMVKTGFIISIFCGVILGAILFLINEIFY
ncbi:DASS family sodium-coupled anion symporter [Candidatus Woesearchaeota archaeon]|nr:DASS family sodium-coupled anion symporter [Candidatus Woesearchaeota archaeon]